MNTQIKHHQTESLRLLKIEDYIFILKRRKIALLIPFTIILLGAFLLAFLLPSIYRSESTILIERQEIPADLVETTVTGYVQERIEGIAKKLLTRNNLWEINKKLGLYPESTPPEERFEILTEMRRNVEIQMLEVKTSEPDQMRQGVATVAFTIAYESKYPQQAQSVTNELANLFIEENKRLREEHAMEVSKFLESEAEYLNAEITKLETELAKFKQTKQSQLPELMNLILQLYEKTDNEIERTKEKIQELEDRAIALQAELAITKPHQDIKDDQGKTILTGEERLSLLTAEYLRLSARYSAEHPDLIKLRREIEALGGESDVSGVTALIEKLAVLKSNLSEARRKYSDDHPDVIRIKQSIAGVERGLQNSTFSRSSSSASTTPDNPRYVSLKTQLDSTQGKLNSERKKLIQLNEKLAEYETRLFQTPTVERDFKLLSRDYDNATKRYREIKDKQLDARLAVQLESSGQGQSFSILQPGYFPETPERPNRLGIILLGVLFASGGGIGAVTFREYTDRKINNSSDLQAAIHAPPIAVVPYIYEIKDKNEKQSKAA